MQHRPIWALACLAMFLAILPNARAATPAEQAKGKTGEVVVTFTERSPLSAFPQMLERVRVDAPQAGPDYDITKQFFHMYIPPQPAEDGKYGLVVALCFAGDHAFAPDGFRPVLDKLHMIWVCPEAGDDREGLQRIGLMLDAAANIPKTWANDEGRIYAGVFTWRRPVTGIGLYYPDVFGGTLQASQLSWFSKLPDLTTKATWDLQNMPPPTPNSLIAAKARNAYFIASRDVAQGTANRTDDVVYQNGYQRIGFKYTKFVKVPYVQMDTWSSWSGEWLDQGLQYLDKTTAEIRAKGPAVSSAEPAPRPAPKPAVQPKPATPPAPPDPATEASRAISLAKSYITAQQYDRARERLKKVVDSYPSTPAAKEAAEILKSIEGK